MNLEFMLVIFSQFARLKLIQISKFRKLNKIPLNLNEIASCLKCMYINKTQMI